METVLPDTRIRRVLDDEGGVLPGEPIAEFAAAELLRLLDTMLLSRALEQRAIELARSGRVSFYTESIGEEASQLAVAALRPSDWVFPSHREPSAWLWRGLTIEEYVDQLFGNEADLAKGRQMPVHHSSRRCNMVSISSPVATQIPQAVGAAHAARILATGDVVLAFLGARSVAAGDFHVGLNFAGVLAAPCVFVCRQPAAGDADRDRGLLGSFIARAAAYGIPGVRVDGGDVLAVVAVTREAVDRARAGRGATLIEAVVPPRPGADPIVRLRGFLRQNGEWSQEWERERTAAHAAEIEHAVSAAEARPAPQVATLFDDVYEELPWHLAEDRSQTPGASAD